MICAFCGDDHSWFYCRKIPEGWKPSKKSTAARKDVLTNRLGRAGSTPASSTTAGDMGESEARPTAGTQAPPVDTKPRFAVTLGSRDTVPADPPEVRAPKASDQLDGPKSVTPKRGRPKTITDMKAYKAKKEHDRRDRIRAAKAAKESK